MAFPTDLEIEVAFNNDIDETDYGQSGWTSILPFVAAFSGDLRGREYELDRSEAGTLSVTLDNSDGRFLPASVQSPYYPYVKSDRRFRVRGKNMVHPNVARGGSRDRSLTGFVLQSGSIGVLGYSVAAHGVDEVRTITASADPNSSKAFVHDGLKDTAWTINTQAGWIQYQLSTATRMETYDITIPAGNTTRNPANWTIQGSNNGSSFTTIDTVTGNTWTDDYETQTFTVDTPGSYLYYRLDITVNAGAVANTQVAEWNLYWNDGTDLATGSSDLTHYAEVTTSASLATNTWFSDVVCWYAPLEYGTRLAHSAYIWRVSGTEPTGMKYKLHVTYFDADMFEVGSSEGVADPSIEVTTLPTATVPTQIGFSHTPPANAKFAIMCFDIFIGGTTNSTPLVYGITGIQSELPANLAPDISGYRDTYNWQVQSEDATPGTVASVGAGTTTGTVTEATSPAYVSGNTTTVTTASFTPTNNSLLVAMCAFGNGTGNTAALGTVTDSLGGTWTRKVSDFNTNQGVAEVWMRDVVTGAAMTVSYARGGTATASGVSLKVQVLTGAKTVANQTGATAVLGGSSAFRKSITTTFANSRVYGAFARAATAVTLAPYTSDTTIIGQIAGSSGDVGAAFDSSNVVSVPSTQTFGFNNSSTGANRLAMIEVLATNVSTNDPTTSYLSVTWDVLDSNLYITIPHLIPGEWYTATVEAQKVGTQPNLLFSGDEGLTGALISTTTMTQYTTTFEATQPEQEIRFILQGTPTATEGLRLRKLRVEIGQSLTLSLPTTATESGVTGWLRPKDIFEGWVESWPAVAGSNKMTITVVDRMKRIGEVELANTLRESLLVDRPALMLPLADSMIDTPGQFSQLGYWADVDGGFSAVTITPTRGDLTGASYVTTAEDGPTGEPALLLTTISNTAGYLLPIPYSKDVAVSATIPPTGTVKPPPYLPSPTSPVKYVYTKKWYATWSRSYDSSGATRFDDSAYMYQGAFTGSPGNQRSIAGFDYKNIMATLKGVEILECYITVTNEHARWNKGLYVFVGTHNIATKPSTLNMTLVAERRWKNWVGEGATVTVNAGGTVGRALRDGTCKGISIGPESSQDNYGYFRGATQSGKPVITVKYRK